MLRFPAPHKIRPRSRRGVHDAHPCASPCGPPNGGAIRLSCRIVGGGTTPPHLATCNCFMKSKHEQLAAHLKRGLAPVYLVYGDAPLQLEAIGRAHVLTPL